MSIEIWSYYVCDIKMTVCCLEFSFYFLGNFRRRVIDFYLFYKSTPTTRYLCTFSYVNSVLLYLLLLNFIFIFYFGRFFNDLCGTK